MGSSDPPYLYDRPASRPVSYPYSQYDPKAISRVSWQQSMTSSRPQSSQAGPLVDFNRHPDSYMVVRGTQRDLPSMPKNTKTAVAAVRWTQFSLRVLQLAAAMGALFCGIVLKPAEQTQSWIVRITPGYDMLITLYAIYHLLRSSKLRTPASSASYHVFALVMDTGLVPLYAFIAIFSNVEDMARQNSSTWSSMFSNASDTSTLIIVCFAVACSLGGLHIFSMGLGLYLVVVFRKIARMPPDMNPLEDNLTSRRASKHKHKNSELSLGSAMSSEVAGGLGGELTVPRPERYSQPSHPPAQRQVPFSHSRAQADQSFSPHSPRSVQLSRQTLADANIYKHRDDARQSALSMAQSFVTAHDSTTDLPDSRKNRSPVRQSGSEEKTSFNDNWYVVTDDPGDARLDAMHEKITFEREPRLPQVDPSNDENFVHQPLKMNPPTPSIEQQDRKQMSSQTRAMLGEVSVNRSSTVASNATITSSVYSESAPSLASSRPQSTPKKLYGDLTAAARGIRGYAKVPQAEIVDVKKSPARVISRSGADVTDELMVPEKNSRRRLFSGRRAEEGMAGLWR